MIVKSKQPSARRIPGGVSARLTAIDNAEAVRMVRAGLPFRWLVNLEKALGVPRAALARCVDIPLRTLSRRQKEGRLRPDESDRLWRLARIFDAAVDLFEGDICAARQWLLAPQPALGGETALEFASTEVGSREVENLIGRLEHGVFS